MNGKAVTIPGDNLILSALGTFILMMGWIGFNGGSAPLGPQTGLIVANTLIAGCFAGMTAMSTSWVTRGVADVGLMMNGTLGGLVAVTASADMIPLRAAPMVGILAGLATTRPPGRSRGSCSTTRWAPFPSTVPADCSASSSRLSSAAPQPAWPCPWPVAS